MDKVLEGRYSALFRAYDVGGGRDLALIKAELIRNRAEGAKLRADAALCLLTLYDQMIVRPYAGQIVTEQVPEGLPFPEIGRSRPEFADRLKRSLDVIFRELKTVGAETPRSSHDVLLAIERAWPELVVLFQWG